MFTLNDDEHIGTPEWSGVGDTTSRTAVGITQKHALAQLAGEFKRLRAERRMTVAALAGRAALGRTTVSKALNGATVPTEETVIALARELGAAPEPLLELRRAALPRADALDPAVRGETWDATLDAPKGETAFERQYCRYVDNRWGKLSVIGLDAARPERSSWPLDVAYLGLSLGESNTRPLSQDSNRATKRPATGIHVEQGFADRTRILIRGLAGCGKTTLLQWLAVSAARGNFPESLSHLNDRVPFLLRLRTLTRAGGLPAPSGYLASTGCQLADGQPQGWVDDILTQGRGLILVDGIDEVAQDRRDETRAWLQELLACYPDNFFAVTTRPNAVREGWLSEFEFSELTIQSMTPKEVAVFIDRWHAAASANASSEEEKIQLGLLKEKLRDSVRAQRGLAQMTTSPLLSALACALHRDRHGHLPNGRMELYEAALSMLLYRRDRERQIKTGGISLSERQSFRLLQRLAYWMVDNGQDEMSRYDAVHHIADALPSMPEVACQGSAEQILEHLIERSGILRAPDDDTVDFVHRTFQDYLAAKLAVERRNFGVLANNAHDDRWEDVIRMAVAHASPADAQQLLRRLISRGDRNTSNADVRHRLHLLAAASLDYAAELDPETRNEVRSRAAAVLPPRNADEAARLARVGPVILDLLPGPENLKGPEAAAVVHTAGLLGGDQSLTLLKRYRQCTKGEVPFYLQLHWNRHDIAEYAREVLSHADLDYLTVSTPEQIAELHRIKIPPSVTFQGDFTAEQIAAVPDAKRISSLDIGYNSELSDMQFIGAYPRTRRLTLDICKGLDDLSALNDSSVKSLSIWKSDPDSLRSLVFLRGLAEFRINSHGQFESLRDFMPLSELTSVYLGPMNCGSLSGVSDWPTIEDFSIYAYGPVEGFSDLVNLPNLRSLDIQGPLAALIASRAPVMAQVQRLVISYTEAMDLRSAQDKFPGLKEFRILCDKSQVVDLSPLRDVGEFVIRIEGAGEVCGTDGFTPQRLIEH
ncbi:NACHT domain-containing NTPase [Streptomyces sp. CS113]|uniref:NACHT domain-containing protein n=1 Tax=Streptomyces sp. CS113 TaxID=1982761 RepID=UPI0015C64DE6|nr:NACHT domain-containing protein [Streptomyces sp. CS113]